MLGILERERVQLTEKDNAGSNEDHQHMVITEEWDES